MNQDQQLRGILQSAPILSKYHGYGGFDRERFIADYEAWSAQKRAALTATQQAAPSQGAGGFQKTQLMLEAEDAGFVTLEGYVHSLKTKLAAALLEASAQHQDIDNRIIESAISDAAKRKPKNQLEASAQREQPAASKPEPQAQAGDVGCSHGVVGYCTQCRHDQSVQELREAIAKKDAALEACVDASDEVDLLSSILRGYPASMARDDALRAISVLRAAITQGQEAMK